MSLWWIRSSEDEVTRATDVIVLTLGLLIGASVEVLIRLGEKERRSAETVSLIESIHLYPDFLIPMRSLAGAMARIRESDLPLAFSADAESSIKRCIGELTLLSEGHLYRRQGDTDIMLNALEKESSLVIGMTEIADVAWWGSSIGEAFRQANFDVIRRGGEVKRIFVLSGDECSDQLLIQEMRIQSDNGVHCRWITSDRVTSEIFINATVIGEQIAHEDIVNSRAETTEYRYMVGLHDIARVRSRLEALFRISTPFANDDPLLKG